MQYLVSVLFDGPGLATDEEQAAIDVFNDKLIADGHWVFAGGLGEPVSATVIDNRGAGEPIFTDGPYVESKEFLAGFWILEVENEARALELAAAVSAAPGPRGAPLNMGIELRRIMSAPPVEG